MADAARRAALHVYAVITFAAVCVAAPARADYWPLEVGNRWSFQHMWFTIVYPESLPSPVGESTWGRVKVESARPGRT